MLKRFLVVLASVSLLSTGVFANSDTVTKKKQTTKHVSAKKHSTQTHASAAKKTSKKTTTASKKKSKKSASLA